MASRLHLHMARGVAAGWSLGGGGQVGGGLVVARRDASTPLHCECLSRRGLCNDSRRAQTLVGESVGERSHCFEPVNNFTFFNRHHKRGRLHDVQHAQHTQHALHLCSRLLSQRLYQPHQLRPHRGKLLADAVEGALRLVGLCLVATNHCTDKALESAGTDNLSRKVSVQ